MKEKVITLLRIIFGKKPVVVQQKVETVQLGPTDLLSGKTAVITGGSSGIGLEIAKAMLKAGASVVITGRKQQKLDSAVELLKAAKQQHQLVVGVRADAMQVATFDAVFQNIVHAIGDRQVDILVNNAGTRGDCHSDFGTADVHDYDVIMDTNLKGAFFFSQVVARYMKENKIQGNILNIASSSSLRPANSAYTLSKWGVRGLTLGMAKTLIPHGIVVNAIAPGPTATPMMNRDNDDVAFPHNPSGRMATAEEIANMAVVLTSGMGRMAVGNILYMTGGSGLITLDDADYEF